LSYKRYGLLFFIDLLQTSVLAQVNDSSDSTLTDSFETAPPDSLAASQADTLLFQNLNPKAKRYKISGTVKDKQSGEAIAFATIYFPGSSLGSPGDQDGNFLLEFDEFPNDTLIVQVMGYNEYAELVKKNVDSQHIVIALGTSSTQLSEVVIRPYEDPIIALMKN